MPLPALATVPVLAFIYFTSNVFKLASFTSPSFLICFLRGFQGEINGWHVTFLLKDRMLKRISHNSLLELAWMLSTLIPVPSHSLGLMSAFQNRLDRASSRKPCLGHPSVPSRPGQATLLDAPTASCASVVHSPGQAAGSR